MHDFAGFAFPSQSDCVLPGGSTLYNQAHAGILLTQLCTYNKVMMDILGAVEVDSCTLYTYIYI